MPMYYVAYGSNMNLEQMEYRCPHSKIIGTGILNNWKLVFNYHLDIVKSQGDYVPVVIWDIDKKDWPYLDAYEGYPKYYIRKRVNVITDDGETIKAIVYVMTDERKGICPPYENYFDVCLQGYRDNGINTLPLYQALKYSIYNETYYNQYRKKGKVNEK